MIHVNFLTYEQIEVIVDTVQRVIKMTCEVVFVTPKIEPHENQII